MLLGKRPGPPIKRTTSMTGITADITNVDSASDGSDHHHHHHQTPHATVGPELPAGSSSSSSSANHHHSNQNNLMMMMGFGNHDEQRFLTAMVSPRNINQLQGERFSGCNSYDYLETVPFLKICGLCKRRLHPARDIYMYRGDTAFCSLECREQQMKQDEEKDKYAAAKNNNSNKTESHKNNAAASTSKKSHTVAAA